MHTSILHQKWRATGALLLCAIASLTSVSLADLTLSSTHEFVHPGNSQNADELMFIRAKVHAGMKPWSAAYSKLCGLQIASVGFEVTPAPIVDNFNGDHELASSQAVYLLALRWFIERDDAYAEKAREILYLWGSGPNRLVAHSSTWGNRALVASWAAANFARGAEILRSYYPGWTDADTTSVQNLFAVFYPFVDDGNANTAGNWEATYADALLSMGVFNEDRAMFNLGLQYLQRRIRWYLYDKDQDGIKPLHPPTIHPLTSPGFNETGPRDQSTAGRELPRAYWYMPAGWAFQDGQCQETLRDLNHSQMGIGSLLTGMEIALSQGLDLYADPSIQARFQKGMEFNSGLMLDPLVTPPTWTAELLTSNDPNPNDKRNNLMRKTRVTGWFMGISRFGDRYGLQLTNSRSRANVYHTLGWVPNWPSLGWDVLTHSNLPFYKDLTTYDGTTRQFFAANDSDPIVIEAEVGTFDQLSQWIIESETTLRFITAVNSAPVVPEPNVTPGRNIVRYRFDVRSAGNYVLYPRTSSSGSNADSFRFRINDASVWTTSGGLYDGNSAWRWNAGFPLGFLAKGSHQLEVCVQESGLRIDQFVVTPGTAPVGAPLPGSFVTGSDFLNGSFGGGMNAIIMECENANLAPLSGWMKLSSSNTAGGGYLRGSTTAREGGTPATTTNRDIAALPFRLLGTGTTPQGYSCYVRFQSGTNARFYYRFNGGAWMQANNAGAGNWGWMLLANQALPPGHHVLEFTWQGSAARLDKVVIQPNGGAIPSGFGPVESPADW